MSIFEIITIIIVAIFVIKPEDIPVIVKKLKELKNYITSTKNELYSHIESEIGTINDSVTHETDFEKNIEQINFYLKKISLLDNEYQGKYHIDDIKAHYRKLMNKKINLELDNNSKK